MENIMQITLDIPDNLGRKLNTLPNPAEFIVKLLSELLDSGLSQDQWWQLLENIEDIAVDTGIADLSERHDDYLGRL
ncbi:MAG: hypothetical protein GY862_18895 [Gammaproteobacteria bacterium]|nr:hypothetical protein [Gammaproteobacteria bacterium]